MSDEKRSYVSRREEFLDKDMPAMEAIKAEVAVAIKNLKAIQNPSLEQQKELSDLINKRVRIYSRITALGGGRKSKPKSEVPPAQ